MEQNKENTEEIKKNPVSAWHVQPDNDGVLFYMIGKTEVERRRARRHDVRTLPCEKTENAGCIADAYLVRTVSISFSMSCFFIYTSKLMRQMKENSCSRS